MDEPRQKKKSDQSSNKSKRTASDTNNKGNEGEPPPVTEGRKTIRNKESKKLWTALKKHVLEKSKSDVKGNVGQAPKSFFDRKWAGEKDDASSKYSESSRTSKDSKRKTANSLREDPYDSDQTTDFEVEMNILDPESEEEEFEDIPLQSSKNKKKATKTRSMILKEKWQKISADVRVTFDTPSRVYKLRGYHSEPDLSLPFEKKFHFKRNNNRRHSADPNQKRSLKGSNLIREKFVSMEDIMHLSIKEYPELIIGAHHEAKAKSYYGISDKMKCSWLELVELQKNQFSFFDELFASGFVVDSLEVPSAPPKDFENMRGSEQEEYFVEADEKHFRKKVDFGRVVFKTKHVYTGNFRDWYFEGSGRYCWEDGTVYQGEFSQGVMHGPGSIHWPDGCIYEGHFINGVRTGWGVYSSAEGQTYAGEWMNGLPHGHGKMWYDPEDDGNDYYEGQLEKSLPEGAGTRQYATGDRYIGNWRHGLRHGYGIMIWLQERQVYKGEWLDGVPNGHGKHIWYLGRTSTNIFPTRHVYTGAWVMGRREGIGKMIYPCGSIYEGSWKNGQRHGKGMFINPAGDILVGIFRAGAIVGGSDVPLHAPTYECDFGGLADWLTATFSLELQEGDAEEMNLHAITEQYLPHIRRLYHRAGEYSQKYGNHGLYPAYNKKSHHSTYHHHGEKNDYKQTITRRYSRSDEPDHMRGKGEKPESLDGVNPVTRFGLWLLMKDCDNLLDEVTMAFYDKIWSDTPPLSFQTTHNPFEPVYLWQFLEALIVASVAYYVEIPRNRRRAGTPTEEGLLEETAVSETTINDGISYDEHKRTMIVRQLRARANKYSSQFPSHKALSDTGASSIRKGEKKGKRDKDKKKQAQLLQIQENGGAGGGDGLPKKGTSMTDKDKDKAKEKKSVAGRTEKSKSIAKKETKAKSRIPSTSQDGDDSKPPNSISGREYRPSKILRGSEQLDNDDDDMEELDGEEGGENDSFIRKSVGWTKENEVPEPEPLPQSLPIPSIAECFETFLVTKLLPCLKRESGANLPTVPQPLPALVDMYDAFKTIENSDMIKGSQFLRSILPHLLFPNQNDALWWQRSSEPLSVNVDMDEMLRTYNEKVSAFDEGKTFEDVRRASEIKRSEILDQKAESEYLGSQAQEGAALKLLSLDTKSSAGGDADEDSEECVEPKVIGVGRSLHTARRTLVGFTPINPGESDSLTDFVTDGNPFDEEELTLQPFLWADDYKCIPATRKYQSFLNINTKDVFDVFRQLYPQLCSGSNEWDLNFDLVFCDWLWCNSLLAKTSTEREFKDAWATQTQSRKRRPTTNPQSLGVYAHYVKQIKNNPYLSSALHGKGRHGDDGGRGVKFSADFVQKLF